MIYSIVATYCDNILGDDFISSTKRYIKVGHTGTCGSELDFFKTDRSKCYNKDCYGYTVFKCIPGDDSMENIIHNTFEKYKLNSYTRTSKAGQEFFEFSEDILKFFEWYSIIYESMRSYLKINLRWNLTLYDACKDRCEALAAPFFKKFLEISEKAGFKNLDNDKLKDKLTNIINSMLSSSTLCNYIERCLSSKEFYGSIHCYCYYGSSFSSSICKHDVVTDEVLSYILNFTKSIIKNSICDITQYGWGDDYYNNILRDKSAEVRERYIKIAPEILSYNENEGVILFNDVLKRILELKLEDELLDTIFEDKSVVIKSLDKLKLRYLMRDNLFNNEKAATITTIIETKQVLA